MVHTLLSKKGEGLLRKNNYVITTSHIHLYRDEFTLEQWMGYCESVGADVNSESLCLAVVGVIEK